MFFFFSFKGMYLTLVLSNTTFLKIEFIAIVFIDQSDLASSALTNH